MGAGCGRTCRPQPLGAGLEGPSLGTSTFRWPVAFRARNARGYTLIELVFVLGLLAVLTAAAIPQVLGTLDASRTRAAARYLAARVALARMQAVTRSKAVAVRFDRDDQGFRISTYADSNRNGVRTRDIEAKVDPLVDEPVRLFQLFPGVDFGVAVDGAGNDPVQLAGTTLLSFTPVGTSTSGSVYVRGRDGSQYAVRVLGATGRVRLLRYDKRRREWTDAVEP